MKLTVVPIKLAPEEPPPKALLPTAYVPASSHSDASAFRERMQEYVRRYSKPSVEKPAT